MIRDRDIADMVTPTPLAPVPNRCHNMEDGSEIDANCMNPAKPIILKYALVAVPLS